MSAGRHHRLLRGYGEQPGRTRRGPGHRRYARRTAGPGDQEPASSAARRRPADRAVLRGQVLQPSAGPQAARRRRAGARRARRAPWPHPRPNTGAGSGTGPAGAGGAAHDRPDTTGARRDAQRPGDGGMVSPWRGTAPELLIAAALVTVRPPWPATPWPGGRAFPWWPSRPRRARMVVLRALLPQLTPDAGEEGQGEADGPDADRLLAPQVRRAERDDQPGLLRQRAAAGARAPAGRPAGRTPRRSPVPGSGRGAQRCCAAAHATPDLWPWIDPATRAGDLRARRRGERRGIPRRTLARLIDRLEKL